MPWPALTEFSEAVQNPQICFKGTELETGVVALNRRGLPLVSSGNFACVYAVSVAGEKFAVRCFTREITDQKTRYNQLNEFLERIDVPAFVGFEYLDKGIELRKEWYPIVKMDWVEGEPLSKFVSSRLNEPDALRGVAAQWFEETTHFLRLFGIAHNDLQHGNVMVQGDGKSRLVDYDGMYLPRFRGQRSPEFGHKNYQHPLRSPDDYDGYVDNFPTLVIYLSLLAVAAAPDLWSSFNNDDNLIFTRNDYAAPGSSELFNRLKNSPDSTVAKLTECLERYCALPVKEVPDLESILSNIPSGTVPSTGPTPPATGGYRASLQHRTAAPPSPAPSQPAATPRPRNAGPPPAAAPPSPAPSQPAATPRPRNAGPPPAAAPPSPTPSQPAATPRPRNAGPAPAAGMWPD